MDRFAPGMVQASPPDITLLFTMVCMVAYCVMIVIGIAITIFWIWMLVDALRRDENKFGETFGKDGKLIWLLLMICTGGIASLVYYFVVYKKYPKN
jgi:prolipoprotein diacylglyceryltransferase